VTADVSTLSWVNMLLGTIWPKANTALIKYVHDELTPRLRDVLPGPFKGLRFARISLGRNVPEFGPIEVRRHSESHVQVELDMRYFSDVDVLVETGTAGISFGIDKLTFVGRLCIAVRPLRHKTPIIGGVQVFFAKQPRVELRFSGLAQAVNEVPGLQTKVQGAVDEFFRNAMVLPNKKTIYHAPSDEGVVDMTAASSHPPIGVLRARVRRAKNLAGANWKVGLVDRFTSDPFCVIRLGQIESRSTTVLDSADPEWPSDEPSAYFVVYHPEQELEITVQQEDSGLLILRRNMVQHLGKMTATTVRDLLRRPEVAQAQANGRVPYLRVQLDTSQVSKGLLHVDDPVNTGVPSDLEFELEWYDIAPTTLTGRAAQDSHRSGRAVPRFDSCVMPAMGGVSGAASISVLLLELHNGGGFPEEFAISKKGLRWQVRLEDQQPMRSKRGDFFFEEPDFGLPLHPRLHSVIEQLAQYNQTLAEIADICDTQPEVISAFLQASREWREKMEDRQREAGEEHCVEVRWHETLAMMVRRPHESNLALDLVEGDDKVVGHLDPIPLQQLLHEGGVLHHTTLRLTPAMQTATKPAGGFLSSLMFPSCSKPVLMTPTRYKAVRMDLSVRLHPLVLGKGPHRASMLDSESQLDLPLGWQPLANGVQNGSGHSIGPAVAVPVPPGSRTQGSRTGAGLTIGPSARVPQPNTDGAPAPSIPPSDRF